MAHKRHADGYNIASALLTLRCVVAVLLALVAIDDVVAIDADALIAVVVAALLITVDLTAIPGCTSINMSQKKKTAIGLSPKTMTL